VALFVIPNKLTKMKTHILAIIGIAGLLTFAACSGNHSANSGRDTAEGHGNQRIATDTSAVTHTTGDASAVDNSGSGGTKVARDSSVKTGKKQ
jgi:hypothetical protein